MTSNRDTNGLKLKNDDLVDGDDEQDLIGVEDGEGDLVGGDDPEVVECAPCSLLPGHNLVLPSPIAHAHLWVTFSFLFFSPTKKKSSK